MNTPTPTPRTDAAWSATFDGEQMSAGQTARALRDCSQQLETELAAITAERDQLRAVFPQICAALANGAFCTPTVSVGFIESIPNEVQLVVAELRARAERAEDNLAALEQCHDDNCRGVVKIAADLATERARLDSGQILLTVAGERVWHCGLDLRAAIDSGMREGAK